mgnify:CR=1 FL=1
MASIAKIMVLLMLILLIEGCNLIQNPLKANNIKGSFADNNPNNNIQPIKRSPRQASGQLSVIKIGDVPEYKAACEKLCKSNLNTNTGLSERGKGYALWKEDSTSELFVSCACSNGGLYTISILDFDLIPPLLPPPPPAKLAQGCSNKNDITTRDVSKIFNEEILGEAPFFEFDSATETQNKYKIENRFNKAILINFTFPLIYKNRYATGESPGRPFSLEIDANSREYIEIPHHQSDSELSINLKTIDYILCIKK